MAPGLIAVFLIIGGLRSNTPDAMWTWEPRGQSVGQTDGQTGQPPAELLWYAYGERYGGWQTALVLHVREPAGVARYVVGLYAGPPRATLRGAKLRAAGQVEPVWRLWVVTPDPTERQREPWICAYDGATRTFVDGDGWRVPARASLATQLSVHEVYLYQGGLDYPERYGYALSRLPGWATATGGQALLRLDEHGLPVR